MPVPSEIAALIERLNLELNTIEREATEGLNFAQAILQRFPNNFAVIQLSGFLRTAIFFVDTSKSRLQALFQQLSANNFSLETEIQELGEDLATDLGRALETKLRVVQVKTRLSNLL